MQLKKGSCNTLKSCTSMPRLCSETGCCPWTLLCYGCEGRLTIPGLTLTPNFTESWNGPSESFTAELLGVVHLPNVLEFPSSSWESGCTSEPLLEVESNKPLLRTSLFWMNWPTHSKLLHKWRLSSLKNYLLNFGNRPPLHSFESYTLDLYLKLTLLQIWNQASISDQYIPEKLLVCSRVHSYTKES